MLKHYPFLLIYTEKIQTVKELFLLVKQRTHYMMEKVIKMAKGNSNTDTYTLEPLAASVTIAPSLALRTAKIKE